MLLAAALLVAGCAPTCEETCDKLVDCGNLETTGFSSTACNNSCELQEAQLDEWNDTQKLDALEAERRCLVGSTCEEIAEGACYDPYIWSYDASASE